jgi:metal-responsive CopG/Arc/MetJ family transcriptional regulator
MLRTHLYIPQELDKEINSLAEKNKVSKAELMRDALKEGIEQIKRKAGGAGIMLRVAEVGKKY